ncbi:Choline/Carnitine O-acyltransferase [Teladorsagia circumcincta]|uniref:Choline/Carnitine O-acyltransferase n=1 Tax=Teladorsagia circumcincta TaxID=45464 RepID=A0A2G9U7B6_TELCI|nr:Choline/Carnitine O-acyltransferase [Teladorsagia circumcincta]
MLLRLFSWMTNDPSVYDREYQLSLTGDGYKLWCDKPSVYTFTRNGRFISNAEHSVVDAMIYVHVREYLKYHEAFNKPYGPDGNCVGDIQVVPKPERLHWELDDETLNAIEEAYSVSKGVADDFENAHCVFRDYGKDFMKKIGVSPDAFLQMAIQMAYYKDQGKFELTYEPTVMRLYREGRTETVRSCSLHSCDFVNSMLDKTKDDQTRLSLLRKACDSHQTYYRNAMAGYGVDRHLFAMYVVSKYYGIQSAFLDNVFSMNYALSTSQTPQHQMSEYMKSLNKERDLFWPAGAFSCPEGSNYGICYTVGATGDIMSFHVTSWKSLPHTYLISRTKYNS